LERAGGVSREEMLRAFNMGVGMVVVCAAAEVDAVIASARAVGTDAWVMGRVRPGTGHVKFT